MNEKKSKRTMTVYLDNDLYAKIKKLADQEKLSVSSFVRVLLKKYIEKKDQNML